MNNMSLILANQMITRAIEKAEELGVNVCIAVTDSGAHLKSFARMDNAFLGSVDVAISKARTSTLFPLPSGTFGELIREEKLTGMDQSNGGLIGFPGGLPITVEGIQVGAIGISGASAEQDSAIAEHAVAGINL
ncbi:MAG: GlcG/HbpS family heme-binding protein [Neptuniibacter sp.]